ncbi:unnamed protein product, partial [Tetraodon nigroviridis]
NTANIRVFSPSTGYCVGQTGDVWTWCTMSKALPGDQVRDANEALISADINSFTLSYCFSAF